MKNKLNNKIDDALYDFYLEADPLTVADTLHENISDLEAYSKKKKQILFLAKAKAVKKHNEYLLSLAEKFQEAITLNIDRPISILKQIILEKTSFALYRNFDKLSKEDIINIIKDKNLIELMEQLEDDEKSH